MGMVMALGPTLPLSPLFGSDKSPPFRYSNNAGDRDVTWDSDLIPFRTLTKRFVKLLESLVSAGKTTQMAPRNLRDRSGDGGISAQINTQEALREHYVLYTSLVKGMIRRRQLINLNNVGQAVIKKKIIEKNCTPSIFVTEQFVTKFFIQVYLGNKYDSYRIKITRYQISASYYKYVNNKYSITQTLMKLYKTYYFT